VLRIFVVDDDPLILKSLSRMLQRPGYEIVAFLNPEELLERLSEGPDLLICDYHLPRRDGVDLAAEAKRVHPSVRTMLLTGGFEDERVVAALAHKTIDRFLSKPWRHEELVRAVEDLLPPPEPEPR